MGAGSGRGAAGPRAHMWMALALLACQEASPEPIRASEYERPREAQEEDEASEAEAEVRMPRGVVFEDDAGQVCTAFDPLVDVIFVVDTSSSMVEEIDAIERHINESFARILEDNGINYRVILIGNYVADQYDPDARFVGICIPAPLGGSECESWRTEPVDGEYFFHRTDVIDSNHGLCTLLEELDEPSADGWPTLLRPDALPVFMVFSDDDALCAHDDVWLYTGRDDHETLADRFDEALLSRYDHFGRPGERRYKWYSLVGLAARADGDDPLVEEMCDTAVRPGLVYQALSRITRSLRYPVCEGRSFADAFRAIAEDVAVTVTCEGLD